LRKFLAVEGRRTTQDRPKQLHYQENAQRFARFADKILHLPLGIDAEEKVPLSPYLPSIFQTPALGD
jgi:hypothetical protein